MKVGSEIKNRKLAAWIEEMVALCNPDCVRLIDGSEKENKELLDQMVAAGKLIRLNEKIRPNSFLARSDPDDVARVEDRTFICSATQEQAGPTNHWREPESMERELRERFANSMCGRTMYIIPFSMGPLKAKSSKIGVQLTDSAYVVVNMRIMTRMGAEVLAELGQDEFVRCMHSVGMPLHSAQEDVTWPCNPSQTVIAHFPEKSAIWSFGSGYGGNALLGKKCFALRIASTMARKEGWLAEHMLIVGVTNPEGKKHYFAAAFPSACGKTNLAMLNATLPGWKIECVGDDIAWMRFSEDGRLYAINPENGFFGVAPGTSMRSNSNAMKTIAANTIFTNVALTSEGDVWWEAMSNDVPADLTTWRGTKYRAGEGPAAHPNARFTAPASQCPVIDAAWQDPKGVPISAILFGGRRSTTIPLVVESLNWTHGVFQGVSLSSETTAAAKGEVGKLRHDPFAMLPFAGYNMADYFRHWLELAEKKSVKLPRIFAVNWFGKAADGHYLWPGFGENCRVLKWIFERVETNIAAQESPIGYLPLEKDFDLTGLKMPQEDVKALFAVDKEAWREELKQMREYLKLFKDRLPLALLEQINLLEKRLG